MKYAFPDNFWWGSASSALQTEGTREGETTGITGLPASRTVFIMAWDRSTPPRFINTGKRTFSC